MTRRLLWVYVFNLLVGLVIVAHLHAAPDDKTQSWGTIYGRVVYGGKRIPVRKPLEITRDQEHCLANGPLLSEDWVVNKENKGVRWTSIWMAPASADKTKQLPIHPDMQKIKEEPLEIDQPRCQFVPHALAMRAGQTLVAKNSSAINCNFHWEGNPVRNPGENVLLAPGKSHAVKNLKADKLPLRITSDCHPWAGAHVLVCDHPYFAVTDADGLWEIKHCPTGKYRVMVWHDTGWGPGGKEGKEIHIKGDSQTEIKIELGMAEEKK
jgi:hypothetical protein